MPDRPLTTPYKLHVLPAEFDTCLRAASPPQFRIERCFFFGGDYWPPGLSDPACASCVGWNSLRQAHADHLAKGGARMDILTFFHRCIATNAWVERTRAAARTLNWRSEL